MARVRQAIKFFAALATIGLICAGLLACLPRERSLLERAVKISGSDPVGYFCWLNDHEILSVYNSGYDHYHVNRYNVAAKTKTNLPDVEKAMRFFMEGAIYPSGDGKRFLCPGFDGDLDAHIVSLDTATVAAVDTGGMVAFAWCPGEASWLYFSEHGARLVNPLRPRVQRSLSIAAPDFDQNQIYAPLLTVTPDNRLLDVGISMEDNPDDPWVSVNEFRLETNRVILIPRRKFSIVTKPQDRYGPIYGTPNPQGDRIYWRLRVAPSESFLQQWIRRLLLGHILRPKSRDEIWSAKLNGTDQKNFGFIETDDESEPSGEIQFSPAGTQIGFVYKGAIYALPAQ